MGRLGVAHAAALLRYGVRPPDEVLTKVELIDRDTVAEFESLTPAADDPAETP
jgi:hypothetical protein